MEHNDKTVALDEYTDLLPDGTIVKKAIVVDLRHKCSICGRMTDWDNQTYTIHGEMICKDCVGRYIHHMHKDELWDYAIKTASPFLREGLEKAREAGYGLWYDEKTHEFTCGPQKGECSHDGCNMCDFYENCRFSDYKEEES